ncbi:pyridoxamine 5'-phosphate oxidase family protein [Microbacterium sp. ZW T5_45]|uniref:pyridoxamine 5'-phosphate oxidase family protein n=1 Tax=Microbacterium sp. ZW T5_45 TaxID=3378080 RepID=UPI003854063B
MTLDDMSSWLRAQPSLRGSAPPLDLRTLPDLPHVLFAQWILAAAGEGVPEPHAMTLATVDHEGVPDARTLILKDVSERGWAFAGPRASRKAEQLVTRPHAALLFRWQPLVREVRVRGRVQEASPEESAADLAARSEAARRDVEPGSWVRWWLVPDRVEFWQGATDRRHTRIVYERSDDGWSLSTPAAVG